MKSIVAIKRAVRFYPFIFLYPASAPLISQTMSRGSVADSLLFDAGIFLSKNLIFSQKSIDIPNERRYNAYKLSRFDRRMPSANNRSLFF